MGLGLCIDCDMLSITSDELFFDILSLLFEKNISEAIYSIGPFKADGKD